MKQGGRMNKRVLLIGVVMEELEKKVLSELQHFHGPNLELVPVEENNFAKLHSSDSSPSVAVIAIGNEQHIVGLVDHAKDHFPGETPNDLIRLVKFGSSRQEPNLDSI
jgi:hypothetical protein